MLQISRLRARSRFRRERERTHTQQLITPRVMQEWLQILHKPPPERRSHWLEALSLSVCLCCCTTVVVTHRAPNPDSRIAYSICANEERERESGRICVLYKQQVLRYTTTSSISCWTGSNQTCPSRSAYPDGKPSSRHYNTDKAASV